MTFSKKVPILASKDLISKRFTVTTYIFIADSSGRLKSRAQCPGGHRGVHIHSIILPAVARIPPVISYGVFLLYSCRGYLDCQTLRMLPTLFQETRYENLCLLVVSNFK